MAMPVDVKLTGLTLPDGAGVEVPLAALPFQEGYTTTFGVFDMMGVRSTPMTLAVTGSERVRAAGTVFGTYRVELTSEEDPGSDQKFWIARENRRLIRSEAKLPAQMGGGTVVSEMVKR